MGGCVLLTLLGPTLELTHWAMDISPFSHVPKLPGTQFSSVPLIALTLVAVLLGAAGVAGLRRRDVAA